MTTHLRLLLLATLGACVSSWVSLAAAVPAPRAPFSVRNLDFHGRPGRVRIAPLDAGDSLDVVASGLTGHFPTLRDFVTVYANDGSGSLAFHWGRKIDFPNFPYATMTSLQVGDLDRDRRIDLSFGSNEFGDHVTALNDGTGRFPHFQPMNLFGGYTDAHMLNDYDGDDILDLILHVDEFFSLTFDYGKGLGDGSFSQAGLEQVETTGSHTELAMDDLDEDGVDDLVKANEDGLTVRFGFPLGGPSQNPLLTLPGTHYLDVVIADLNADRHLDVAAALPFDDRVAIFHGDGTGAFSAPLLIHAGRQPEFLTAGRFDRDGRLDLAVSNAATGRVTVLFNRPGAPWESFVQVKVGDHPGEIQSADLDDDGDDDIVVVNRGGASLSVLKNQAIP